MGAAVRLAGELDHPAYDCLYVVLAHRLRTRLVSADARFLRRLAGTAHAPAVVGLADDVPA